MEDDNKPPYQSFERLTLPEELLAIKAFERRFDLIQQVIDYINDVAEGRIKSGLFPYQVPAFLDAVKFLQKHAQELENLDQLTLSGYLDLPTSFGKTVMMAKLLLAFGIGKQPEHEPHLRKALVLVPSQQAVEQTIGVPRNPNDDETGFAQHAPDLVVGSYYEYGKNLDGDATVMTYASFLHMLRRIENGELTDPDFDVIMCDEAQYSLGPQIRQAVESYRQGKIAIGLTATPEYDDDRTIQHIFAECIHKSELLPLIESGKLNGVQLIGLATDSFIKTRGKGNFTERELRHLIDDEARNMAITEMAKRLIAEGRRGVINAVAGEKARHATLLAELLNGREVIGPDGNPITIRAEAVSSYMDKDERRRILREYKEGKIHVLTQVKALNESWDEDEVSFIINAAPTGSKVRACQRIGRGMRPNGEWPITVIVEFLDEIVGRKRAVTAWDVFGEDDYAQNTLITTPERYRRAQREQGGSPLQPIGGTALASQNICPPNAEPDAPVIVSQPALQARSLTFNINQLPDYLRASAEQFALRIARELTIKPQQEIGPPKPGWVELMSLLPIAAEKDMGIFALRSAITHEGGFACELAQTPLGERYFVEPGAVQFATDYEPQDFAPKNYKNLPDLERELDTTRMILEGIISELKAAGKIKGRPMRSRILRRALTYYSPKEITLIKAKVDAKKAEVPTEDDPKVFLTDLEAELGVVRGPIQFFLLRHHGIIGQDRRSPKTNQKGIAYEPKEADIARFHYGHEEIGKRPVVLLERIEQETGLAEDEIRRRVEVRELGNLIKKGRFADARGDYHYTLFCEANDFLQAKALLTMETWPPSDAKVLQPATPPPASERLSLSIRKSVGGKPNPQSTAASSKMAKERPESQRSRPWVELLSELRCNPAAAHYLLSQMPFAGGGVWRNAEGELIIEAYAATLLSRRCQKIGPPPKASRSDRYFAKRFRCPIVFVHSIVKSIVPEPSQVGLFRTDDDDGIITFHYNSVLSRQIEHVLRQKLGSPQGV